MPVRACQLPDEALLGRYTRSGAFTDCYVTELPGTFSHAEYVRAFYTTWVFRLERAILKWAVARPSTDEQARQLAEGSIDSFAAWHVEGRSENQLLMSDFQGRTRSWFMTGTQAAGNAARTRLYFGSAVVPVTDSREGTARPGPLFSALLGFHKLYSRVLLGAAKSRLSSLRVG
ncbi:MAG: hypothetical protein OEV14_01775 [Gammaproteobacteria bacterium]|nr:hypothetical protein [Gammaproteobacteria bacterium]